MATRGCPPMRPRWRPAGAGSRGWPASRPSGSGRRCASCWPRPHRDLRWPRWPGRACWRRCCRARMRRSWRGCWRWSRRRAAGWRGWQRWGCPRPPSGCASVGPRRAIWSGCWRCATRRPPHWAIGWESGRGARLCCCRQPAAPPRARTTWGGGVGGGGGAGSFSRRTPPPPAPPPPGWAGAVARGAAAVFPLRPTDLMPALSGPALGRALAEAEAAWIAADFTLDAAALRARLKI
jgi:hypothetical protein